MNQTKNICDPDDAPVGYYAFPLSACNHDTGNLCRQCDWRTECQKPETDSLAPSQNCRGYALVATRDGKTYQRKDKCGVVFKKKVI